MSCHKFDVKYTTIFASTLFSSVSYFFDGTIGRGISDFSFSKLLFISLFNFQLFVEGTSRREFEGDSSLRAFINFRYLLCYCQNTKYEEYLLGMFNWSDKR